MTLALVRAVEQPQADLDLRERLDPSVLKEMGWDEDLLRFDFPPDHPIVGYRPCPVDACRREATTAGGFCTACVRAWEREGSPDQDAFMKSFGKRRHWRERECLVCCVDGFRRPANAQGLCRLCNSHRKSRGQSVEAFVKGDSRWPPAEPRETLGACRAVSCGRLADVDTTQLCLAHHRAWGRLRPRPELETFLHTASPVQGDRTGSASLAGIPPAVVTELLFGAQTAVRSGTKVPPTRWRAIADLLRAQQPSSILDVDPSVLVVHLRRIIEFIQDALLTIDLRIENEVPKDKWDLRAWGMTGTLSFVGGPGSTNGFGDPVKPLQQPWLKEAAKLWACETLVSHRTDSGARTAINGLGRWSAHLARREDRGLDPAALTRMDITSFLASLAIEVDEGRMVPYVRNRVIRGLRLFLRESRDLGLTGQGKPLEGLAADVAVRRGDSTGITQRRRFDDDEAGDAIPEAVLAQLLHPENLDKLSDHSQSRFRLALETGRRPAETCGLAWDCLVYDTSYDENGQPVRVPVLLHDMPKVGLKDCRLPIKEDVAEIIRAQQRRVRDRYPLTSTDQLRLFPRANKNPDGSKAFAANSFAGELRAWADSIELLDGVVEDGELVPLVGHDGSAVRFPSSGVFPYALRHTYAQRHIENGTDVVALCALMGHSDLTTTQGYFRISAGMQRRAVELMTSMQFNVLGSLVPSAAPSGSDHLRYSLGQIAVPMGSCTEPSNVSAVGRSCEFRHRCFGCGHFRTDPSYLTELQAYLERRLADRERLRAAVPGLAEWARREVIPSDDEIEVVERLIANCKEKLNEVDEADRPDVVDAIAVLRRGRRRLVSNFPAHLRDVVAQSQPSVFPLAQLRSRHES